jgi:DNA-binding transcriptional MerR regulator
MHTEYTTVTIQPLANVRFRHLPGVPLEHKLPTRPLAIADMANLFGVTHRTLHFYEEKKLIHADRIGAMRIYGPHQVKIMALINLCRETGMSIAQIQDLFGELETVQSLAEADTVLRQALAARKRELLSAESLIRRQMQQVSELLEHTDNSSTGSSPGDRLIPDLTEAETQLLNLMAHGYTAARISQSTGRAVPEVLAIEASIVSKFGSVNRFQAVAKAVLLGMIGI